MRQRSFFNAKCNHVLGFALCKGQYERRLRPMANETFGPDKAALANPLLGTGGALFTSAVSKGSGLANSCIFRSLGPTTFQPAGG
jgi:hypothetical protein